MLIGHNVSFSRSSEKDLVEKLDGLLAVPQEWHKKKEDLVIHNKNFNLSNQTAMPGTMQNIRHRFHHHKVLFVLLLKMFLIPPGHITVLSFPKNKFSLFKFP